MEPVYGILINDFDQDGYLDVVLSGNKYGTEVGVGSHNASKGILLNGDGKGEFKVISAMESGLRITGNSRGEIALKIKDRQAYFFGRNSDSLKAYVSEIQSNGNSFLDVLPNIAKAIITCKDGTERLQEFYYGSSYLSQSSRTLFLYGNESKIVLYDFLGKEVVVHEL